MPLKTQGFQVSALPQAPRIPPQIGKVDIKAIDEGVRRGLQTFEMIRQAPQSMALADATMAAKTAQAPLGTRLALAETEAAEAQLPYKTAILAAEASPEYLDAKIKHMLRTLAPANVREFDLMTAHLSPAERERARAIALGLVPRQSSAAIQYKEVVGPDGRTMMVAVDPRAVGAHVVGSGQTYGSGVPTPGAVPFAPAATPTTPVVPVEPAVVPAVDLDELGNPIGAAPAVVVQPAVEAVPTTGLVGTAAAPIAPVNIFASPTLQEKKSQEVTGAKTAEMVVEAKAKLPKAFSALASLEGKTDRVEKEIDEAIARANNWSVGYGSLLKNVPNTEARKMAAIIRSIDANIGFDALQEMRTNSPTGGALGQVSDFENKLLKAVIADLDQATDVEFFRTQLGKIKTERQNALNRLRSQIDRERSYFGLNDADFSAVAAKAREPLQRPAAPAWDEAKEKRLQELRSKLGK